MICYSLIEKRGDYIIKYINWKLISDNKLIVNNEVVECEFDCNILKYYEDDTINIVDLENDIYVRENNEFTFKIDFKNRCFDYILKKEELSIKNAFLEATITKNDKEIHLKYNLGDDKKEIIIHLL